MHKFIFLCSCFIISVNLHAQNRTSNNSSLDSIKKGIKTIGNIFKKAGTVRVIVKEIDVNDKDLVSLKQNIQRITGVMKIKDDHKPGNAVLVVSYKGKGNELWQNMPESSRQIFSLISSSDTAINLSYKYAKTDVQQNAGNATTNEQSVKNITNAGNVNTQAKKQSSALSKGAVLLFKNVKTKLSNEKKQEIFNTLGFQLSKDAKQFITDNESADYPFEAFVYPTDMNNDGKDEIFVLFGNTYTSGMTGSSITVLIADKSETYKMNLDFPGTLPDALATSNLGYNDLLIGGPGFEFPVWRWNGKEYDFLKKVKEAGLNKLKFTSVEDVSKAYAASIK